MTKYIKGKDGKFKGSISSGKTNVPRFAPYMPDYSKYVNAPADDASPTPPSDAVIAEQSTALIEELETSYRESLEPGARGRVVLDSYAKAERAREANQPHLAAFWSKFGHLLETSEKEQWSKEESVYLGVHWMHLMAPHVVRNDGPAITGDATP